MNTENWGKPAFFDHPNVNCFHLPIIWPIIWTTELKFSEVADKISAFQKIYQICTKWPFCIQDGCQHLWKQCGSHLWSPRVRRMQNDHTRLKRPFFDYNIHSSLHCGPIIGEMPAILVILVQQFFGKFFIFSSFTMSMENAGVSPVFGAQCVIVTIGPF